MNDAKKNYVTTQKECRPVVWSVLVIRTYNEGIKFIVQTDHKSLRRILDLNASTSHFAC